MAQRQRSQRVSSEVVQGKGSYVIVRRLTLDEARQYQQEASSEYEVNDDLSDAENKALQAAFNEAREVRSRELLSRFIIEWDWVDDDGNPLPQPKTDPDVFLKLTDLEFQFLSRCLTDMSELEKKGSKHK